MGLPVQIDTPKSGDSPKPLSFASIKHKTHFRPEFPNLGTTDIWGWMGNGAILGIWGV